MNSIFNNRQVYARKIRVLQIKWFQSESMTSYHMYKLDLILSQNGLEGQWPPFQYQQRVSRDACLVQI